MCSQFVLTGQSAFRGWSASISLAHPPVPKFPAGHPVPKFPENSATCCSKRGRFALSLRCGGCDRDQPDGYILSAQTESIRGVNKHENERQIRTFVVVRLIIRVQAVGGQRNRLFVRRSRLLTMPPPARPVVMLAPRPQLQFNSLSQSIPQN